MSAYRVASRYAKSLLELAVEKGVLEQVREDMNRLVRLYETDEEFATLIKSPIVSSEEKLEVLKPHFKTGSSELTLSFFELVSHKGREAFLPLMAKEFLKQYNAHEGIQSAEVVTTVPLSDKLRAEFSKIVKEISGKDKVALDEKVDKDLIGGFVLKIEDRQLDESLKSKLRALHLDFTQNLYEKKF
jgi:F-type H+-transporting ATPase subunit delta